MADAALPEPPIPSDVTMAGNDWFPLYFDRLRKSKWWRRATDLARARNIMLWGECFKQVPAGSFPDDDDDLAEAAGFGMDVEAFLAVKAEIMAPWTLCSDGRWYHPTMCEVALDTWERHGAKRKAESTRKADYRRRVRAGLGGQSGKSPPCPEEKTTSPAGQPDVSRGTPPLVPAGLGQQTDRQTVGSNEPVASASPEATENTPSRSRGQPWTSDPEFLALWKASTDEMRKRSKSREATYPVYQRAVTKAGGKDRLAAAHAAYLAKDPDVGRTGGPGLDRWLRDGAWEHWLSGDDEPAAMSDDDWSVALRLWRSDGSWLARFGPKPGEPGCKVPPQLLITPANGAAA